MERTRTVRFERFSPTIPLDEFLLLLSLLSLLLLLSSMQRGHEFEWFLVSLVDAWRIERGVLLDFPRFPSSIIMTRETPAVVVSRTVFEREKGVEKYGLANTRSDLFEFERHSSFLWLIFANDSVLVDLTRHRDRVGGHLSGVDRIVYVGGGGRRRRELHLHWTLASTWHGEDARTRVLACEREEEI